MVVAEKVDGGFISVVDESNAAGQAEGNLEALVSHRYGL